MWDHLSNSWSLVAQNLECSTQQKQNQLEMHNRAARERIKTLRLLFFQVSEETDCGGSRTWSKNPAGNNEDHLDVDAILALSVSQLSVTYAASLALQ